MDEFKKGDIVFLKSLGKFAQIYADPLNAECIRVNAIGDPSGTYNISPRRNVIKVDPDTLENRLLIQLKYG